MTTKEKTKFEKLSSIDVSAHIEKKTTGTATLSYLSWAWAWDYFKKEYPDAKYEIKEWEGKPYLFDEKTGYMVETSITAGGETHIMWLPVMDGANRSMTDKPYQVQGKYKTIEVAAATMFDINKTIMRCLVKNMAMFGLGLYIYAGEDLPQDSDSGVVQQETQKSATKPAPKATVKQTVKNEEEERENSRLLSEGVIKMNDCFNLPDLNNCMEKIKSELGAKFEELRSDFVKQYNRRKDEIMKETKGFGI